MGKLDGKVAFITGAARGQGRSHAIRLAHEGADIIAVDICDEVPNSVAPGATREELDETVAQVEALGRGIVADVADVRDLDALKRVAAEGVSQFGRLDVVAANAGVFMPPAMAQDTPPQDWQNTLDINLTGHWHTTVATIPHLIAGGRGGSIILTVSAAGLIGYPGLAPYVASKHGIVGLMRTLALELGAHNIRVNSLHPTMVNTPMAMNEPMYKIFRPDLDDPGPDDFAETSAAMNALPVPWIEPDDVSNAVLFLASDDSRYMTGTTMSVDLGVTVKK